MVQINLTNTMVLYVLQSSDTQESLWSELKDKDWIEDLEIGVDLAGVFILEDNETWTELSEPNIYRMIRGLQTGLEVSKK